MFGSFHRRVAKLAPLTPDAADGEARRITGTVRLLDDLLRAPYSGRVCVAYGIRLFGRVGTAEPGGAGGSGPFETVELRKFAIGETRIDSQFALIDLPYERVHGAPSAAWDAFCDERHVSTTSRADEAVVQPGAEIMLAGIVERRVTTPRAESGYRDGDYELWLVGDFDRPLLITR
jgi:hypothetical protein